DGYLWLTTTGGLARFDGVRFTAYGMADGLSSNRFQGLAVDHAGTLWISAEDGTLVSRAGTAFRAPATARVRESVEMLPVPAGAVLAAGFQEYWAWRSGVRTLSPSAVDTTTTPLMDAAGRVWLTLDRGAPARLAGDRVEAIGPPGQRGDHWVLDQRSGTACFVRRVGQDAELL